MILKMIVIMSTIHPQKVLFDRMQRHLHIHLPHEVKHLSEGKSSRYDHCKVSHDTQFYQDSESESESDSSDLCDDMSEGTQDETFAGTLEADIKLSGRFSYNIRIDRRTKRRTVDHKWVDRKKRILNNSIPSTFIGKVLSDAHMKYCQQYKEPHLNKLNYECFTRAKIKGISYKAQPNWRGKEWYDWAVIKFPKTKASVTIDVLVLETKCSALVVSSHSLDTRTREFQRFH